MGQSRTTGEGVRRLSLGLVVLLFLLSPAIACAAPAWNLDVHHGPTDFAPDGSGELWFDVANIGDAPSTGTTTLTVRLRGGLTRREVRLADSSVAWSCPGSPGDTVIVCSTTSSIPRHTVSRNLFLTTDLAANASGDRYVTATVQGGGAPEAATENELVPASADPASFGMVPGSFVADAFEADGRTADRAAGSRPAQLSVSFDLASVAEPAGIGGFRLASAGNLRHFRLALPDGLVGNPTAAGRCSPGALALAACPRDSQVGRADLATGPVSPSGVPQFYSVPVFNLESPHAAIAAVGFSLVGNPVTIRFALDPASHYTIVAEGNDLNESFPLLSIRMTLWGDPSAPGHDSERCGGQEIETASECPVERSGKAFLTLPSQCDAEPAAVLREYDSWQHSGVFGPEVVYLWPGPIVECDRPRFEPRLSVTPSLLRADTPTGYDVRLEVPQHEGPSARAAPPVQAVELTLPEGVRLSPPAAEGLAACTRAEIGLGTDEPVACPDASRIGEASLTTPLLPSPLQGAVYLARPGENTSGGPFGIYLAVHDEEGRGVLIKASGSVEPDPATGRIAVHLADLPELPFEDLELHFRDGPRSPLVTAPSCGSQETRARISSYAAPDVPVETAVAYTVGEGSEGGPCPSGIPARFSPRFRAGTLSPVAGAASPLVVSLGRSDSEARLEQIEATLPAGLSARTAGIPICSAEPACAGESRLGNLTVGVGSGSEPLYLGGSVYLGGPYRGAPFSLLAVVPAAAGPFDFAPLTSRLALFVDPVTGRLRVVGEPLPQIVSGVPVEYRSIRLLLDRPGLIRNPTSCEPAEIAAAATAADGRRVNLSTRFQVGSCGALGLKPRLSPRFSGATGRNGHPTVTMTVRPREGDANLRSAALLLPRGVYLDQSHIGGVCTRAEFGAGRCPADSVYGHLKAWTPLLDQPLEGDIYLREGAHRLPDLAANLDGEVHIVLGGRLSTPHARVRASFDDLPDVPFSRLDLILRGGKRGLLVDSENVCSSRLRAVAAFAGQNGKSFHSRPRVAAACGGAAKRKRGSG